jgi:hypothetical protein
MIAAFGDRRPKRQQRENHREGVHHNGSHSIERCLAQSLVGWHIPRKRLILTPGKFAIWVAMPMIVCMPIIVTRVRNKTVSVVGA